MQTVCFDSGPSLRDSFFLLRKSLHFKNMSIDPLNPPPRCFIKFVAPKLKLNIERGTMIAICAW